MTASPLSGDVQTIYTAEMIVEDVAVVRCSMKFGLVVCAILFSSVAIAQTGSPGVKPKQALGGETIKYNVSACYGTCPVYSVTLHPDGKGIFNGERFTATTGPRDFKVTRRVYRRFAQILAPYRPAANEQQIAPGQPGCGDAATDAANLEVRWTSASGQTKHLWLDRGCRGAAAISNAFVRAENLLPIRSLIKAE